LLCSGILKILIVGVLLSTGWKGGTFFPLMSSGAMLGLLLSLIVPGLPTLVPMVAGMAAIAVITLDNVVIVLLMMLVLTPLSSAGASMIAIGISVGVRRLQRQLAKSRLAQVAAGEAQV